MTEGRIGVNRTPHDWTWQKTGVHWYCSHCAIAMEWLPGRQRGRLLRPLDHVLDPNAPCTWYIYKDEAQTRAYHYPRTGTPTPPDAPDFGEDWRAEYPGGSESRGIGGSTPHPNPLPSEGRGSQKPAPRLSEGRGGQTPVSAPAQGRGGPTPLPSPSEGEG